jgi:hypothetical protein
MQLNDCDRVDVETRTKTKTALMMSTTESKFDLTRGPSSKQETLLITGPDRGNPYTLHLLRQQRSIQTGLLLGCS